ncbi:MAG: helix-turn-helix transcriptional regulator [Acidobacteriaceae bacterium]|nr:helix-turn-helix transcriptional regulator [Acidobacteriaceae bacterium]MBV9224238.1 helix-turn-helix transcriptional regulator [Acidobacteriaceae bacterium]MBV9304796.1 helix-turn-helix transcriptional regulator [Acidobacteriaceae bacterium]MBV9676048.1 helix-turn-helix transcriptional regulator [Acidobacteriaceae bacterium]MBV9937769.1 helix-turn-helix transcriptional regulator [Acidobacteriaceae bacterium]
MLQRMSEHECPVKLTVDIIGGKWKTLILYFLKGGPQRTGALQQRIIGISKKMLTQQLREMQRDGLIERKDYGEVPPRVEYSLTHHGETLKPILELMAAWGAEHRRRYDRTSNHKHHGNSMVNAKPPF